jgi:hypothetical protein
VVLGRFCWLGGQEVFKLMKYHVLLVGSGGGVICWDLIMGLQRKYRKKIKKKKSTLLGLNFDKQKD